MLHALGMMEKMNWNSDITSNLKHVNKTFWLFHLAIVWLK